MLRVTRVRGLAAEAGDEADGPQGKQSPAKQSLPDRVLRHVVECVDVVGRIQCPETRIGQYCRCTRAGFLGRLEQQVDLAARDGLCVQALGDCDQRRHVTVMPAFMGYAVDLRAMPERIALLYGQRIQFRADEHDGPRFAAVVNSTEPGLHRAKSVDNRGRMGRGEPCHDCRGGFVLVLRQLGPGVQLPPEVGDIVCPGCAHACKSPLR